MTMTKFYEAEQISGATIMFKINNITAIAEHNDHCIVYLENKNILIKNSYNQFKSILSTNTDITRWMEAESADSGRHYFFDATALVSFHESDNYCTIMFNEGNTYARITDSYEDFKLKVISLLNIDTYGIIS